MFNSMALVLQINRDPKDQQSNDTFVAVCKCRGSVDDPDSTDGVIKGPFKTINIAKNEIRKHYQRRAEARGRPVFDRHEAVWSLHKSK